MAVKISVVCSLICAILTCGRVQADTLHLYTEDIFPINIPPSNEKNVSGIAGDKIVEVFSRANIAFTVEVGSWARMYTIAKETPGSCVFSTARTPEREPFFKWVFVTAKNEWILYGRVGRVFKIKELSDARPYLIGSYYSDALAQLMLKHGLNVILSSDNKTSLKNLLNNRLDLWATGRYTGEDLIQRYGAQGKVVPVFLVQKTDLYLACNRSVPDSIIEKLTAAMKTMIADGTIAKIEHAYRPDTQQAAKKGNDTP